MKKIMNRIFNFIKNNGLLILAAYWLVDFVFCLITSNPADDTARKIKSLILCADLLWSLVLIGTYLTTKTEKHIYECIKLVDKKVDIIWDAITEAKKAVEEESEDENGEENKTC